MEKYKRSEFEWYWKGGFNDPSSPDFFERTPWWNGTPVRNTVQETCLARQNEVMRRVDWSDSLSFEIAAALERYLKQSIEVRPNTHIWYELLRRHPENGRWRAPAKQLPPGYPLLTFLLIWGTQPWPSLSTTAQQWFQFSLEKANFEKGNKRAVRIINLVEEFDNRVGVPFLEDPMTAFQTLIPPSLDKPAVAKALEELSETLHHQAKIQVNQMMLQSKRDELLGDDLIFRIPRDATMPEIEAAILPHLQQSTKVSAVVPGRDTSERWLKIIYDFELSEENRLRQRKRENPKKVNEKNRCAFIKLFEGINLMCPDYPTA